MEVLPSRSFKRALAEIIDAENVTHGAGVVIGRGRILTCAHVVTHALRGWGGWEAEQEATTEIAGPFIRCPYRHSAVSEPFPTRLKRIDYFPRDPGRDVADLAILTFDDPDDDDAEEALPPFGAASPSDTSLVYMLGFPGDRAAAAVNIDDATYSIGLEGPNKWRSMTAVRDFGSNVRGGFSGGPGWSLATGEIIGITAEANDQNKTALLIPIEVIRKAIQLPLPAAPQPGAAISRAIAQVEDREITRPGLRLLLDLAAPRLHALLTMKTGMLTNPSERAAISDHLGELSGEFETRMSQKIYLPPPAAETAAAPGDARMFPQLIRALSDRANGGDGANAAVEALSRRSRRVRHVVDLLRHSREPIILLGEPGAGKSMTLQQVVIALAKRHERRIFPTMCIFVPLGQWLPSMSSEKPDKAAVEALVRQFCPQSVLPYLTALRNAGRLVVIFDGMDEMSRDRYVEHTDALDRYANANDAFTKTLFSCRVADFSSSFSHRRLILLPFNAGLVAAYLQHHLQGREVVIDGAPVRIRDLAKRLISDDLAIQATNPYVLYLLSLYIRDNSKLPAKRTDLLAYYYRDALARKRGEEGEAPVPAKVDEALFNDWGAIALEITGRNRGSEIDLSEIELVLSPDRATEALRLGKLTGLLVVARESDGEALKFENHRAQEFFCAWAIAHSQTDFAWLGRLDAPRWQETLVNVAQLSAASGAIDQLELTVASAVTNIAEEKRDGDDLISLFPAHLRPGTTQRAQKQPISYAQLVDEADAAERIDLTARVARELPTGPERDRLTAALGPAIATFLHHGTPTAQSTMLRTLQRSPELGSLEMMERVLRHPASWIREQAYAVASSISAGDSREGVLTEIGLAFADWSLPGRVRSYMRIAGKLHSRRIAALTIAGAALLFLQALAFCALPPLTIYATIPWIQQQAQDAAREANLRPPPVRSPKGKKPTEPIVARPVFARFLSQLAGWWPRMIWPAILVSVLGLVAALLFSTARLWLYTLGVGLCLLMTFGTGLFLLNAAGEITVPKLLSLAWLLVSLTYMTAFFLALLGAIVVGLGTTAWVSLTVGTRTFRSSRLIYENAFKTTGISSLLIVTRFIPIIFIIGIIFTGVFFIFGTIPAWLFLPIPYIETFQAQIISSVLYIYVFTVFLYFLYNIFKNSKFKSFEKTTEYATFGGFVTISICAYVIAMGVVTRFLDWISGFMQEWSSRYFIFAIIGIVLLVIIAMLSFVLIQIILKLHGIIRSRLRHSLASKIDPQKWRNYIMQADPRAQAAMIANAKPTQFDLALDETVALLLEIQPYVVADPAVSRLQVRIAELLSERRQDRG